MLSNHKKPMSIGRFDRCIKNGIKLLVAGTEMVPLSISCSASYKSYWLVGHLQKKMLRN